MARNQTYDELKQRVKVLEKEAGNRKRAEEALRESEERYRLLADNVTDVIWIRDMNLRFTYISPSVTKMTGYSVEEAMAFSLEDVYTPASIEVARNALAEELTIEKMGNADPFRVRTLELESFCKDGSMIWTEAKMSFLRGPAGQVVGIFGVSRDISQRRQAEEALRESEKRYRSILETAPHSITITRVKDGRCLQVNEAFCQMRGYSREEALGRTPFELNLYVNPEDRERIIKILKEKGEVNGFEVQYQKRDGTAIDTLVSARPLEYENEDCLIAVVTDITELKQAEEALKKRLAYEKMLADISTRAILIEDKDISRCLDECLEIMGKTLHVSRIYIFEYHHEPGTADNTFEWVSDGIAPQKENLQGLPMKKYPWWMEMMNNNKIISYQDIEDIPGGPEKELLRSQSIKSILVVPLFVNNAFYGFMGFDECLYHRKWLDEDVDILKTTAQIISNAFESKQAEEALRESENIFRLFMEHSPIYVFFKDENIRSIRLSRNYEQMLGRSIDELLDKTMDKLFPSDLAKSMIADDLRVFNEGKPVNIEEKFNGRFYETTKFPILINGKPKYLAGYTIDITQRKVAEEALRESEGKFRNLAEQSPNMIFINKSGKVVYANRKCEEITGYKRDELHSDGFDFHILMAPECIKFIEKNFKKHMSGEEVELYEYTLISKSGKRIEAILTTKLIDYEGEKAILGIVTDITERKQLEKVLQEKDKSLERQAKNLEEVNVALKVLLEHREKEKIELKENMLINIKKLIFPYIEKLQNKGKDDDSQVYVNIIKSNLEDLISPLASTLSSKYFALTPTEIQVTDLIKQGKTSKEIAAMLNVSPKAVSFHRGNIRKKLGLLNKKINLKSYLHSFPPIERFVI